MALRTQNVPVYSVCVSQGRVVTFSKCGGIFSDFAQSVPVKDYFWTSVLLYICPSVCLSVRSFIRLSVPLSILSFVCLSVCLSICERSVKLTPCLRILARLYLAIIQPTFFSSRIAVAATGTKFWSFVGGIKGWLLAKFWANTSKGFARGVKGIFFGPSYLPH